MGRVAGSGNFLHRVPMPLVEVADSSASLVQETRTRRREAWHVKLDHSKRFQLRAHTVASAM